MTCEIKEFDTCQKINKEFYTDINFNFDLLANLACCLDDEVLENIEDFKGIVVKIDDGSSCKTSIIKFGSLFDAQSDNGTIDTFPIPSDRNSVTLYQQGGADKSLTANFDGDYLVDIKAKFSSTANIESARLRAGVVGSGNYPTLDGFELNAPGSNPAGEYWLSGSRTYTGVMAGDEIGVYITAETAGDVDVDVNLVALSIQLDPGSL